jgi:carotenoid 1,2-hydratase
LAFDRAVAPGGYAWWYLDALSDDRQFGLTIIGFLGSVFSPYYAWKGRRDPLDHCALNVALYGPRGRRWCMTERRRGTVDRQPEFLRIGPSAMRFEGGRLVVEIDEIATPRLVKVRGRVTLTPQAWNAESFALAPGHQWRPIAPFARAEVAFSAPDLAWSGEAYLDFNGGDEPLEAGFRRWTWSRARTREGAAILYEGERRDGGELALSLRFRPDGGVEHAPAPPLTPLPATRWRLPRATRSQGLALVTDTFEDAPFYARARIAHRLDGEDVVSMHETLDLDRFSKAIVKAMLPFRMPRV